MSRPGRLPRRTPSTTDSRDRGGRWPPDVRADRHFCGWVPGGIVEDMAIQGSSDTTGADERSSRVLGWICGLSLVVAPWIVAGVLATVVSLVGPDSWDPETSFPWLLLAAFVTGLGGLVYGSVRNRGFRRGALPGAAVALGIAVGLYVVALVLQ